MDRKGIFLALFIFIIIAFSFYFTLEENPVTPPEPAAENEELPEEELENVNFSIFNDQQEHELKLESENLQNYKNENRMELRPIEAEVYSTNSGQLLYTLTGDFAIYYTNQDYLEIRGNVLIDSDRYQIESEELDYYLSRNYLEGRGSVKITGSDFNSRAQSFNSDLNLNNLKLSGNNGRAEVKFDSFDE
ncbi:LPS export ABC transporter protein LptC [Halanaerobium saccharolyticum]|uniref:LPS export ABC transporter protein LptC n=1 Tax=Halanaerobium saccharolyticum TaxID=43595 RepID=A0A4R7Z906_9FIRM|nr:LPS export ABC transporter periplasmic protein LptC [Halanaerobium saccharolyticum]RAK09794.1 LPS export ABC transporter protein LptC [Halanaerobium saccharolyticum]TDW07356.1 LPS export ABC transporter protein LptC [Halanaerobium saccharolyticum]TDX61235.1 LPS export ABC transporter protein LptC [Halanaerobium saccharolyticum]